MTTTTGSEGRYSFLNGDSLRNGRIRRIRVYVPSGRVYFIVHPQAFWGYPRSAVILGDWYQFLLCKMIESQFSV